MFYNVPSRKKALQKPHEEYVRIVDLVSKYAIHNAGIAINLKRGRAGCNSQANKTRKTKPRPTFTLSKHMAP